MKKLGLLIMPVMAIPFLISCGNKGDSTEWVSYDRFKSRVNTCFVSKPFQTYVASFVSASFQGETYMIETEIKGIYIYKYSSQIETYEFQYQTQGSSYLSTIPSSILSPGFVDYNNSSSVGFSVKFGFSNDKFVIEREQQAPSPFKMNIKETLTYNKDLVLIRDLQVQNVGSKQVNCADIEYSYKN